MRFLETLSAFELAVIVPHVKRGTLIKPMYVSVRNGRLYRSLSSLLGTVIESSEVFSIDYYGYSKKSRGLLSQINELLKESTGMQISAMRISVVYFASIKVEDIAVVAPDMVSVFPFLKKEILTRRGFKNGQV